MRLMKMFCMLTVFTAGLLTAAEPLKNQPLDLKGVRILVCAGYFDLMNIPAIKKLSAAGAEVRSGSLADLSWSNAANYHVIITVDTLMPAARTGETSVQVLDRFVKAGGGVFYFSQFMSTKEEANAYLAPLGAAILREYVLDPQNTFKSPTGFNLTYAYTERVTPGHPVTEGVKGIWYNAQIALFNSSSIRVSPDWKVLVMGEPSATTESSGGLFEEHLRKPGVFQSSPPIIAAREYGAGAIVLTGISPMEAFYGQGLPAYQDIMMQKGNGMRSSDFGRLYENSLRWLAQHGKASKELGVGSLAPLENSWTNAVVHDWSKDVFGGDSCVNPMKGVIGLHSTLSDGKTTPQALIEKAKASGLRWVAFTEKFDRSSTLAD